MSASESGVFSNTKGSLFNDVKAATPASFIEAEHQNHELIFLTNVEDPIVKEVIVKNCNRTTDVIKTIKSPIITEKLRMPDTVLVVKFVFGDMFENLSFNELNRLSYNFHHTSGIVYHTSKSLEKFTIYWKSKDIRQFLVIKSPEEGDLNDVSGIRESFEFTVDFLIESLKNGRIGVERSIEIRDDVREIGIHVLADDRSYNLMMLAAEKGEVQVVRSLLNLGFSTETSSEGVTAQSIAYENNQFSVLLALLQMNFTYPDSIDIDECTAEIKEFYSTSVKLHEAIISQNSEKVIEILMKYPDQRYFFNLQNTSAGAIAIMQNLPKMYELLLTHNVHFAPHEDMDKILENLEINDRKRLRNLHLKYTKELPEKHLNTLVANSNVGHDATFIREELVRTAFKDLNNILLIRIILIVVATLRKFTIIFDFHRSTVQAADPTSTAYTDGIFYLSGRISIGALQLLDETKKSEALGTLAHELCHFAMYLTFNNDAKPYRKQDKKTAKEFAEILKHCEENYLKEDLIGLVFECYPKHQHHAELIVRVPHLLAYYHDMPERLNECREIFRPLFNFYEQKVVPEMEKALGRIERKCEKEIKKKDKKIRYLTILIIALVMAFIGVVSRYSNDVHGVLSEKQRQIISNAKILYGGVEVKFSEVFPSNSSVYNHLKFQDVELLQSGKLIDISEEKFSYLDEFIFHSWSNLTTPLKGNFFNSVLNFQGVNITYREIYVTTSLIYETLSSKDIFDVLRGKIMSIGSKLPTPLPWYVSRTFSYENVTKLVINESEVIARALESKFSVLLGNAGFGQTTNFKYLARMLKQKHPSKWIVFINVKDHTRIYEENEFIKEGYQLLMKILKLDKKSEFERNLFKEYYNLDQVVLFWNRFNEVSFENRNFVLDAIKNIRSKTKNVQLLSTRPMYVSDIEKEFNIVSYSINPYDQNQQVDFLKKSFKFDLNIKSENQDKLDKALVIIKKLEKFQTKLTQHLTENNDRQINMPLMLITITDLATDPEISEIENIFFLIDRLITRKHKKSSEKGCITQQGSFDAVSYNIHDIYSKYAILNEHSAFGTGAAMLKILNLRVIRKNSQNFPYDQINKIEILYVHGEYIYEFSHRLFSEYYVAKYLVNKIYLFDLHDSLDEYEADVRIQLFFHVVKNHQKGLIVELIESYIMSDYVKKHFLKYDFHKTFKKLFMTKYKDFLIQFLKDDPKIFEFLIEFFKKDKEVLAEQLHSNDSKTIFMIMHDPILRIPTQKIKSLSEILKKHLTNDEFLDLESSFEKHKSAMLLNNFNQVSIASKLENINQFWTFIENSKSNLTLNETNELLLSLSDPRFYVHDGRFSDMFNSNHYEMTWLELFSHIDETEKLEHLAKAFINAVDCFNHCNKTCDLCDRIFLTLSNLTSRELSSSNLYELFLNHSILHSVIKQDDERSQIGFQKIWDFIIRKFDDEKLKSILWKDENDEIFSRNQFPPFNVVHLKLINSNEFDTSMFDKYFNIADIFNSTHFLPYYLYASNQASCSAIRDYMNETFSSDKDSLQNIISRKFAPRDLTMYGMFSYLGRSLKCFKFEQKLLKIYFIECIKQIFSSDQTVINFSYCESYHQSRNYYGVSRWNYDGRI